MNRDELVIYGVQFIAFLSFLTYLEYKHKFTRLSLGSFVLLFFSSVLAAAVSAYIAELDSRKYLKDALLLRSFLDKDASLYGLFFLSGGNGLYPSSYFPMLIASNTWSNYTSFTIEKFYLFFSLLSKPNLYNISLFFGILSFFSKSLLLHTFTLLDTDRRKFNLLYIYLLIGGTDIFFISSVYKENLLFLFFSFILYTFFSSRKTGKAILALLCLLHALFLRLDTVIVLLFVSFVFYLVYRRDWTHWRNKLRIAFLVILPLLGVFFSSYRLYFIDKFTRYERLLPGNTHFEMIDWKSNGLTIILQILIRWRQAFLSFYTSTNQLIAVSILSLLSLIFIAYHLCHQNKKVHGLSRFLIISYLFFFAFVSLIVPNYVAILRYRSPLFVLLIFGLILNIRKKSI